MITVERQIRTDRATDLVAHYLSDFRTTAQWDPHTVECTRLDTGPLGVGSRFANTQRVGPLRPTLNYEVADYQPGHSIRLVSKGAMMTSTDTMRFEPDGAGGTTTTYRLDITLPAVLRLAEPLLRRAVVKVADGGAAGLRQALERLPRRQPGTG
jgi:hypothetical protein